MIRHLFPLGYAAVGGVVLYIGLSGGLELAAPIGAAMIVGSGVMVLRDRARQRRAEAALGTVADVTPVVERRHPNECQILVATSRGRWRLALDRPPFQDYDPRIDAAQAGRVWLDDAGRPLRAQIDEDRRAYAVTEVLEGPQGPGHRTGRTT